MMRRTLLFLLVFGIPSFAVMGTINTESVSTMLAQQSKQMIEEKSDKVKDLLEGDVKEGMQKRLDALTKKYILIRKIKELRKRRLLTRRETIKMLRQIRKERCQMLTQKIALMDKKIRDFVEWRLIDLHQKGVINLGEFIFYASLFKEFLRLY